MEGCVVRELRNSEYIFVIDLANKKIRVYESDCWPDPLGLGTLNNLPTELWTEIEEVFEHRSKKELSDFSCKITSFTNKEDLTTKLTKIYNEKSRFFNV